MLPGDNLHQLRQVLTRSTFLDASFQETFQRIRTNRTLGTKGGKKCFLCYKDESTWIEQADVPCVAGATGLLRTAGHSARVAGGQRKGCSRSVDVGHRPKEGWLGWFVPRREVSTRILG